MNIDRLKTMYRNFDFDDFVMDKIMPVFITVFLFAAMVLICFIVWGAYNEFKLTYYDDNNARQNLQGRISKFANDNEFKRYDIVIENSCNGQLQYKNNLDEAKVMAFYCCRSFDVSSGYCMK